MKVLGDLEAGNIEKLEARIATLESVIAKLTSGEGNPSDENAVVGSEYTNMATGDKWIKTASGWQRLAVHK